MDFGELKFRLLFRGVCFAKGLTDGEIAAIEDEYQFVFPPDYRQFLQTCRPIGRGWVDWRDKDSVRKRLNWPWEGMAFDIEHNDFWLKAWGPKPESMAERLRVAKELYDGAPRLIPIYSHRYIPADPSEAGNPIFSVYQTDIIYYGYDLMSYLEHEFGLRSYESLFTAEHPLKQIAFWSDIS